MRISEVLRRKGHDVVTLTTEATIADVVAVLVQHGIGVTVIRDDDGTVAGIVSERDVIRHVHGGGAPGQAVTTIMSSPVLTCAPADEIEQLAQVMTTERVRHLPVVEDGELIGIVSIGDIVKQRLDELQHERDQLVNYVQAGP